MVVWLCSCETCRYWVLTIMCLKVALLGFNLFGILWVSKIWTTISLPEFGMLSAIISLNILSALFFFYSPCICTILSYLMLSHKYPSLFFILFVLWGNLKSLIFEFIDPSAWSGLLLKLLYSSIQSVFISRIFVLFILMISISLLNFLCIVFLISFSYLSMYSWSSLHFSKRNTLAWCVVVHGVAKSWAQFSSWTTILPWRIPWTEEAGEFTEHGVTDSLLDCSQTSISIIEVF